MCGLVWAAYIFSGGILKYVMFGGDKGHGGKGGDEQIIIRFDENQQSISSIITSITSSPWIK